MFAQLLIAASFAISAYQDIKNRAVSDLVWIPAGAGTALIIYETLSYTPNTDFALELTKLGLVGIIAVAFTYKGAIGQADAIALFFIAADPYRLSPIIPLVAAAAVALSHIGYELAVGNARGGHAIPIEQFLREQKWIPKAILADGSRTEVSKDVNVAREEVEAKQKPGATIEVAYGVPTVAYLGIGYVAYLAYLIIFNLPLFQSLP